ncbi:MULTISPECIES: hypothetical protein [unclassified Variovorax]|uniref:hypothetical protein n=1 Tax=unclassified Variovorax TaxID=663243 RepID=UPI00076C469D|nr:MULTISPECIES: hypothetical protein [unclassified Variovorax]KWT86096.1 hypothetical protein APY03_3800 [Variovorax sp. WDL1]PNG50085.1 hypothetical protein CHC06_05708 [Variovorax sp. B2]PNG50957.1 hypothetical protein CHC07_05613 [Variovorax sp. B4]VTU41745.1 hypothetical protein SRS16P1_00121 [Variovorax sp. SRS16]VTU41784.1 hypothetical protein E5P1_00121 [Variovorax sp. PBL-E5]
MADEIDMANEQAELFLRQSLANRATGPKLLPRGSCYNCDTHFVALGKDAQGRDVDERGVAIDEKLFCDKDCADDFTERERLKARR